MKLRIAAVAATMAAALAGCGGTSHVTTSHVGPQQLVAPASCAHGYVTPYGCQPHSPTFGLPPAGIAPTAPPSSSAPTVEQFDSVVVSTVPPNPAAVAGYVGGSWPTYLPLVHAFPRARHISIAVNAGEIADCLDVEPGDAVPSQAGGWARWMLSLHHWKPCEYTSLSEMPAVEANDRAVLGPNWRSEVRLWDANWTYFAHLDLGYDCTQWTNHALVPPRNLDESTCALTFYAPAPPPPDPYAVLDKTIRRFANGVTAREYNTAKTWDAAHCQNPARRYVCTSSVYHLRLLAGRIWYLAHHNLPRHDLPAWGLYARGARFHILWSRVTAPSRRCFAGPVTFTSCPGVR